MAALVPDSFDVPEVFETGDFRIRKLTIHDAFKDYEAVMTSYDHLHQTFSYARQHSVFGKGWPYRDLTLTDDIVDLGWHQAEFNKRSSFTYTVVTPDESRCIGCLYILPGETTGAQAEVYMWVSESEYKKGLDPVLFSTVKNWIKEGWPFKSVVYPGREG